MTALLRHPGLVLADRWQRGFPLCERPFAAIGKTHDLSEHETIETLAALQAARIISRVGAVVRPNTAGASTLAALACPPERLTEMAELVSAESFVNHNYERGHPVNLWFVVAAPGEDDLDRTLRRIEARTGLAVLDLRLQRPYHIDLGFGLAGNCPKPVAAVRASRSVAPDELALLAAIEDGLPLVPRPFAVVARRLGTHEADVISALAAMMEAGIITRFGCVIRHREVGFAANAMAVWDVPDGMADALGERLARVPGVTLCYRRNRQLPLWRYNLFAMVHGRSEADVRARLADIAKTNGLSDFAHAVLFSRRCFTQRGARFSRPAAEAAA